jgi:hypothetical protein
VQHHPIESVDTSWLRDLVLLSVQLSRQLDELDEHIREAIDAAYMRGVHDATEVHDA